MLIQTLNYYFLASLLTAGHAIPFAGFSSAAVVFYINKKDSDPSQPSFRTKFFSLLSIPFFTAATVYSGEFILSGYVLPYPISNSIVDLAVFVGTSVAGVALALFLLRSGVQILEKGKAKITRSSDIERNKKTDVRNIHLILPEAIGGFNPRKFFNEKLGIFIGLDEEKKPKFINYATWKQSHCLLTGRTRCGKGIAAQILLFQAILRGEFVVILDPKVDNWMPHIFRLACKLSGKPYNFLDLRQSAPPQTNPFAGCDLETLENMLVGGFSLTEKGEAADFYRLADRKAARECAAWLVAHPGATARDALIASSQVWAENAAAFHSYMEEMAELVSVNAVGGLDFAAGEQTGGCLYVVGDMINPRIIRMQRMILLRLLFLAKSRDNLKEGRTICVFADEFKVHISRPFITSLGASAGWGLHTILAFQSLQDLADCPADLDKDAVRGSVMENCAIQLSYAIKDPETAEWLASSTGTVLVDDETRTVEKNIALSETLDGKRSLRQAERYLIDTNMLMNLPKGCAVLAEVGKLASFCYTSPVTVARTKEAITPVAVAAPEQQTASTASIEDEMLAPDPDDFGLPPVATSPYPTSAPEVRTEEPHP